ncbi:hypothetical protein NNO04_01890 [Citrobacter sp. Awk 4]|uniref:hypothetical protein n=1 Tax=Citrobacter sp. Awk 4 TaxID=2963955 RepID=UPI002304055A|nr:hypothetical protein [Citrobacter sp. Awk 4]MDA8477459.1 hypothetical protein [Citrobacter sp. Awk 4]
MSLDKMEGTTHSKLKQYHQQRMCLIIGGVCSLVIGVLNIISSGYIEPYDGGQIILGLGCLGYSMAISKKISQLRAESQSEKQ